MAQLHATRTPRPEGNLRTALAALLALLGLPGAVPVDAQEATPADRLHLEPCAVEGVAGDLRCGTFRVPENREEPGGRRIELAVTVLPATGAEPEPDPVVYLAGGPGAAATGLDAAFEDLPRLRRSRDVVLLDQRGTGDSNGLDCDLLWGGPEEAHAESFLPVDRVRACREELSRRADLTRYTTPAAADDLDGLRRALGHERINLWGGSYGTRAALVYLRRHGEHARSVLLGGLDLSFVYGSAPWALAAERSLDRLSRRCRERDGCRRRHPDLRTEVDSLLRRLERRPASVRVPVAGGDTVRTEIGRDDFAEGLRYLLYQSRLAVRIPRLVELGREGRFRQFGTLLLRLRSSLSAQAADGLYLSVDCAESVPRIDSAGLARADSASFLRGDRARERIRACAEWPRGELPAGFHAPVRSPTPTLLLVGGLDPTVPTGWTETLSRWLPNSRRVVFPNRGHELGPGGADGCMRRIVTSFLADPSPDRVDAVCARDPKPLDFPSGGE